LWLVEIALATIAMKFVNIYRGFAAVANIRIAKYACYRSIYLATW